MPNPETVASHMFRMGVMAMVLQETEQLHCYPSNSGPGPMNDAVVVSLLHDLGEALVGDITPKDGVSDEEKHRKETGAYKHLVKDLPGPLAAEIYQAFDRYENQAVGDGAAVLVKDLDKFDMILQADEYEADEPVRGNFLQVRESVNHQYM